MRWETAKLKIGRFPWGWVAAAVIFALVALLLYYIIAVVPNDYEDDE